MNAEEAKTAQSKYVEAKLEGKTGKDAALAAGYSIGSNPSNIERVGGPVHTLMVQKLKEKGIDEEYVAGKYKEALESSLKKGAKDKDLNGASQLLRGLTWLMGYGKSNAPTVAVQINNNQGGRVEDDPIPTRELVAEVSALVEILNSEVSRDRSTRIYEASIVPPDANAHEGVDQPAPAQSAPDSAGLP